MRGSLRSLTNVNMIHLFDLTKIYRTPDQPDVCALDGVTLTLPDSGMVFVTGKSGSGKTTLLNVIGGLDKPDGGDVTVDGSCLSAFTPAQYDAYRRTFVGFVFQEYNLIRDLTVGENIALSVRLQGGEVSDAQIADALAEVDLAGYETRLPTALSGGQRQRVAIARSLVRDPGLVLADEPTGALDGDTAQQVMQALKQVSADRLVLVVSHDKRLAEQYGDRIIEMSEGRVVRDSAPLAEPSAQGAALTLPKGRLPRRDAGRMAVSGIRSKRGRFAVSILLCLAAFLLVGLSDVISAYDKQTAVVDSFAGSHIKSITLLKQKQLTYGNTGTQFYDGYSYTDEDIQKLSRDTGAAILGVYQVPFRTLNIEKNYKNALQASQSYGLYTDTFSGFAEITDEQLPQLDFTLLAGRLPDGSRDEIAISRYMYDCFRMTGYRAYLSPQYVLRGVPEGAPADGPQPGDVYYHGADYSVLQSQGYVFEAVGGDALNMKRADIGTPEDLIGRTVSVLDRNYTITGIIDTGFDSTPYASIRKPIDAGHKTGLDISNDLSAVEIERQRAYGTICLAYVGQGKIAEIALRYPSVVTVPDMELTFRNENAGVTGARIARLSDIDQLWSQMVWHHVGSDGTYERREAEIREVPLGDREIIVSYDLLSHSEIFIDNGKHYVEVGGDVPDAEKLKPMEMTVTFEDDRMSYKDVNYTVVGTYANSPDYELEDTIILPDDLFDLLSQGREGKYAFLISSVPDKADDVRAFIRSCEEADLPIRHTPDSVIHEALNTFDPLFSSLTRIFRCVGLALILFAALMFGSFISSSIAQKKRDVGILRALGAGERDVSSIFFTESLIAAGVTAVLSCVLTAVLTAVGNAVIGRQLGVRLTLFRFGWRQILILCVVSLLVGTAAAALPVARMARKKPVELIN